MDLTDEQITALVGGKDTPLHSHPFDRSMTHQSLDELQHIEKYLKLTANYTATYKDDFLLVDSTAGAVAILMPFNKGQKEITVVRIAGTFNVTLNATGVDTINGFASLVITNSYVPVHLKGFDALGWVQI